MRFNNWTWLQNEKFELLRTYLKQRRLSVAFLLVALLAVLFLVGFVYQRRARTQYPTGITVSVLEPEGSDYSLLSAVSLIHYRNEDRDRVRLTLEIGPPSGQDLDAVVVLSAPRHLQRQEAKFIDTYVEAEHIDDSDSSHIDYQFRVRPKAESVIMDQIFFGDFLGTNQGEIDLNYRLVTSDATSGPSIIKIFGLDDTVLDTIYPEPNILEPDYLQYNFTLDERNEIIVRGTHKQGSVNNEFSVFLAGILIGVASSVAVEILVDMLRFIENPGQD